MKSPSARTKILENIYDEHEPQQAFKSDTSINCRFIFGMNTCSVQQLVPRSQGIYQPINQTLCPRLNH